MTMANQPGSAACYVNLAGSSKDGHPHGGRDLPTPEPVNRRAQVAATAHPATDRWVVLTTFRTAPTPLFRVSVVNGHNYPTQPPAEYPTLRRARSAANKLYKQLTEETS